MTMLAVWVLLAAGASALATAPAEALRATSSGYHDGVFGPESTRKFCTSTQTYTPSRHIRTKIVRSTDRWSNTISSRYRKFTNCTARQMTSTEWCTTKLVDGVSTLCISTKPKASGVSPCRNPRLDVRAVYHPSTRRVEVTCVNRA